MGWEWRVFFPIAASRSEDDSTPKEESKAEDTAAASVNVNAIWRDLGVREDSFGAFSKGREDMYAVYRNGCGVKVRGGQALEVKFRTKKAIVPGFGKLEKWRKYRVGTFSAAWKAADRFVRKHEGEKMSKFSPTILSAPTLVTTHKRRRVVGLHGVVLEDSRLRVSGPSGAVQSWGSISVEGRKADIVAFLASPAAQALKKLPPHDTVVGGYPTFVAVVAAPKPSQTDAK